jgi:hypothetical protein
LFVDDDTIGDDEELPVDGVSDSGVIFGTVGGLFEGTKIEFFERSNIKNETLSNTFRTITNSFTSLQI